MFLLFNLLVYLHFLVIFLLIELRGDKNIPPFFEGFSDWLKRSLSLLRLRETLLRAHQFRFRLGLDLGGRLR